MVSRLMQHARANLVAYLALFVALGGTSAFAASKLLPANSVSSRQVIDHSLLKQDFKQGQLSQGPKGKPGPPGTPGPPGADASLNGVAAGGALSGSYPNPSIRTFAIKGSNIYPNSITPQAFAAPEDWQAITDFQNGWGNAGNGYPEAAYYVDAGSVVHLKGAIAGGTVSNTTNGTAFTIHCPFAPDDDGPHLFAVVANHTFGELTVVADTNPPNWDRTAPCLTTRIPVIRPSSGSPAVRTSSSSDASPGEPTSNMGSASESLPIC